METNSQSKKSLAQCLPDEARTATGRNGLRAVVGSHKYRQAGGLERKFEMTKKRQKLIWELEELHRKQRGWQRAVHDEELDYEAIEKIPTDELEKIVSMLRE